MNVKNYKTRILVLNSLAWKECAKENINFIEINYIYIIFFYFLPKRMLKCSEKVFKVIPMIKKILK